MSLDIKNSQPYFSSRLFDLNFYDEAGGNEAYTLQILYPDLYQFLVSTGNLEKIRTLISDSRNQLSINLYRHLGSSGKFYEYFMKAAKLETPSKLLSRNEVKKIMYLVFFGDPLRHLNNSKWHNIFKEKFPVVVELFTLLKSREHNNLALLLQHLESRMVIQDITRRFHQKQPTAPIFTIHDSILTTEPFINQLKSEILDHLVLHLGVAPKLTSSHLHPQAALEIFESWGNSERVEQWVSVPEYDGYYEMTDQAQYRSLHLRNRGGLIKTRIDRGGYETIRLSKNGKEETAFAHRLLALRFIPNLYPEEWTVVNHINGNKTDNLINLEWISPSPNVKHTVFIW